VLPLERRRPPASPTGRRGIAARVAVGIAAATAVAAGATAFLVSDEMSRQEERLDRVAASVAHEGMRRAAEAAASDPRARTLTLATRGSRGSAMVVAMPGGDAFLMATGIPRLEHGRTYQLWAVTGEDGAPMVPAGLLGRSFDVAAFHVPEGTRGFVVTEEGDPGVAQTDAPPVLEGSFT
jgi:hypothetical protein